MIRATFVLIFFLSSGLIFADYRAGDKGRISKANGAILYSDYRRTIEVCELEQNDIVEAVNSSVWVSGFLPSIYVVVLDGPCLGTKGFVAAAFSSLLYRVSNAKPGSAHVEKVSWEFERLKKGSLGSAGNSLCLEFDLKDFHGFSCLPGGVKIKLLSPYVFLDSGRSQRIMVQLLNDTWVPARSGWAYLDLTSFKNEPVKENPVNFYPDTNLPEPVFQANPTAPAPGPNPVNPTPKPDIKPDPKYDGDF